MICAVLDAEGTPHKDVWVEERARVPTADDFVQGLKAVREKFPARELLIYYGLQLLTCTDGHWAALPEASERPEFHELLKATFASAPHLKATDGQVSLAEPEAAPATETTEGFTTLDNILIRTVVAAANNTEGALSTDALEDLVQEVLALNSDRHRSFFHLGYLDAVLKKSFREQTPGSNNTRRGWSFAGYLMGLMRSASGAELVAFIRGQIKDWEELLASGPMSARTMLLPHLAPQLAQAGEWQLVERMLATTHLPTNAAAARSVCRTLYDHTADLVRTGKATEAIPLLKLLRERVAKANQIGSRFRMELGGRCARKLGQAYLRNGRFAEAKALLKESLEEPQFSEAANGLTDLGLAEAGFRSLDYALPKEEATANDTIIRALEKQLPLFQQSLEKDGRGTNAYFILGLIAVHREKPAEAEQYLNQALEGMLEKEQAYQRAYLIDWVRFLLAISVAEQCEPARLNEVRARTETAIASPAFFPLRLWTRLCHTTLVYDDKSVAEGIIAHLLEKRGDPAYSLLKASGLLFKNSAMRGSYLKWLNSQKLSPSNRAAETRMLLEACLRGGNHEEAVEILDALECVAKTDTDCIAGFVELLKERRADLLALWTEDDMDATEAALLERIGKLAECAEVLQKMFYRHRAEGDWDMVEDILAQLAHLKLEGLDLAKLAEQVEHLRPAEPSVDSVSAPTLTLDGIAVLYIGGHETQMRYEAEIRKYFSERHPGLEVALYFPGWTSNWIDHFERLERLIPKNNVVVINNYVRTQLGRKLRAVCDAKTPWRACTGHGRKSLIQAIEGAAMWVADKTQRAGI